MRYTNDGGATWTSVRPPFVNIAAVAWAMPYLMDSGTPTLMFAGSDQQVFYTTSGGLGGAPAWSGATAQGLYSITALDEGAGGGALVAGDSQGRVAATFDNGDTWRYLQFPSTITVVRIDPFVPLTFFVGYRDRAAPFVAHLIRVSAATNPEIQTAWDAGLSTPVDSLMYGPGFLLAGTDRGLYKRALVGGRWIQQVSSAAAPGIPSTPVVDLKLATNGSRSIVALTHGRGAWRSNDAAFASPNLAGIGFSSVPINASQNGFPNTPVIGSANRGYIAPGADSALWFTGDVTPVRYSGIAGAVWRIGTNGSMTEYRTPTTGALPAGITLGPDGAEWFAEYGAGKIGRITTAGSVTEYAIPTAASGPVEIVTGTDGNLWFTENRANRIGRMTPAGVATDWPIPTLNSLPTGIASGSDGNIWFTEYGASKIGRIKPDGTLTEYPTPATQSYPMDIVAGPDGALWFGENGYSQIGRITTGGQFREFPIRAYCAQATGCRPSGMTVGADGAIWFTTQGVAAKRVNRIATDGTVQSFANTACQDQRCWPAGIATGSDGALWYLDLSGRIVWRVALP